MRLLTALLTFCAVAGAEVVYSGYGLIAHLADGGGVQVEITLTNLDDAPATYTLGYVDDNGNPLSLLTTAGTGSSLSGSLGSHASRTIRTLGISARATEGWAFLEANGVVGASAIFHVSVAPWAGSEAMLPLDTWRNGRFSLTFDHTGSTVTGLALVNPSPTAAASFDVTFKDEGGNAIVSDTVSLPARNHRSIVTTAVYPATVGKRGTIEITASSYVGVLGLRFGPSAISSVLPLVNSKWAATASASDPYNGGPTGGPGNPNDDPYKYY